MAGDSLHDQLHAHSDFAERMSDIAMDLGLAGTSDWDAIAGGVEIFRVQDAVENAAAALLRAATLLREGADLISVEVDALKSGISINGEMKPGPEDAHTVAVIGELEAWIARAGDLITALNKRARP